MPLSVFTGTMSSLKLFLSFAFLALPSTARTSPRDSLETIRKDVLVIGGGSAGTFGAIRLHDAGKSVAVVEMSGKLGGHADTFYSDTGGVVNVGVQILYDLPVVTDYFARLGVPLFTSPASTSSAGTIAADFSLGIAAPPANVSTEAIGTALQRYGEYLAANFSTVYPGYYLPDPVPEDFLMPYGDFMTKYGLDPIVNLINTFIQPAEAWREPALFPLKLLSLDPLKGIASGSFKVTHDVNDLYRAAASILGDSVLFNSSILSLKRSNCSDNNDAGVEAIVQTPHGTKRILASKLLMAAPPVAANLAGWQDLDPEAEAALFSRFKTQNYQAGVIRNQGLLSLGNATIQNIGFTTPFNIPQLPALFNIVPTGFGDGTAVVYYTSRDDGEQKYDVDVVATAQADTLATLDRLAAGGVIPVGGQKTEILEWYNHVNVRMYVEPEEIRGGFYRELYKLQGQRHTYWSGAAWVTQASSPIWDFTRGVVDEMLAVL